MNTINEVPGLTPEMSEAIKGSLQVWAEQGYGNAVIPIYHDVDGDDKPDYLGLDGFGQLEVLSEDEVEDMDETEPGYEGPAWVRV